MKSAFVYGAHRARGMIASQVAGEQKARVSAKVINT